MSGKSGNSEEVAIVDYTSSLLGPTIHSGIRSLTCEHLNGLLDQIFFDLQLITFMGLKMSCHLGS